MHEDGTRKDRILEFQSKLLKELALTASSLQKGETLLRNIAANVREVFDVCFLYAFQTGMNDRNELRVCWCATPGSELRAHSARLLAEKIAENASFAAPYDLIETTAAPSSRLPEIDPGQLDLRTHTFSLDTEDPIGMVGLGLPKHPGFGREDDLAVENVLITLMNGVCSSKALAVYTREVERFATRDPLTNLYNQVAFWDLLNYETERSKRQGYTFALLLIDLDNFKLINDSYGHDTGDLLLIKVASLLRSAVRAGDITARYAGDEFTAILPVCDEGQAQVVARRIIETLRQMTVTAPNGSAVKLTASIGLAVFPDHAREAKDLYLLADSILLKAKTFGKDRVSMPSEQDDVEIVKSMSDKHIMILEALSQRRIVPYFQPIVNMQNRAIMAYEVLTRIVLDDRVVPATEFIETAESMGAIGKLDYQLIEAALMKVQASGYAGDLFLNLSPRALVLEEFMPTVRRLLAAYGMDPSRMIFEITEREAVKRLDVMGKHMQDLKKDGYRFAIDDFGAGYSSFHYLRELSVDYLKVDGEFIRNMNSTGTVEKAIVSSIAALAEKLGIKTIAEFVESSDIMDQVRSTGIHFAQGFYIQRPSAELCYQKPTG